MDYATINFSTAKQLIGYTLVFAPGTVFSVPGNNSSPTLQEEWTDYDPTSTESVALVSNVGPADGGGFVIEVQQNAVGGQKMYAFSGLNDGGISISREGLDDKGEAFELQPETTISNVTDKVKTMVSANPLLVGAVVVLVVVVVVVVVVQWWRSGK